MRNRMGLILAVLLTVSMLPLAAQDKAPAKPMMAGCGAHMQEMKAIHDKVMSTWKDVEGAKTAQAKDAALKAHGAALAEMEAAHKKMEAGCCGGDMNKCMAKMGAGTGKGMGKGMGNGGDCPCCGAGQTQK